MNEPATSWTFLTHHARMLLAIARDPASRIRDTAAACNVSERTAQAVITDLDENGYLSRERLGRRTHYTVHLDVGLRHPAEADVPVQALLALFTAHDQR
ncbi:transcriptional regulator [Streptomyces sp. NPDC006627]|uniref:transcriptional regulator n=1 Tax=Streptomyces sp. NPDC006627 TaxID=3154679 RepID=UPI0033A56E60